MDNLLADIAASFIRIEKGKRYQRLSRVAIHLRQVAGFVWNWRPQCHGITGRLGVEWVAGMAWNTHPEVSLSIKCINFQGSDLCTVP
jgi:hypothetical protein